MLSDAPLRPSADVVIVGGGIIGCSIAYHLADYDPRLRILVIERDPSYELASTPRSFGVFRIQFGLTENIRMSLYGHEVLKRFEEEMAVDGEGPGIEFRREGYLFMYSPAQVEAAKEVLKLQTALGARVQWWEPKDIAERYPLLSPPGLGGGIFSPDDGHLDPYRLMMAYRAKAKSLGVDFAIGEASSLVTETCRISGVRLASGDVVHTQTAVNAAGGWAVELARTAGVELPVLPVMRQFFAFEPALKPETPLPFLIHPSGLYLRSETGGLVIVGYNHEDDPIGYEFAWHRGRFENVVWPCMVEVIPAFDRGRLVRGWAGLMDENQLDRNAILGEWPEVGGLYLATGFTGHGLMHSAAAGRYMAERILGREVSLDLSVLGPERVLRGEGIEDAGVF